MVLSSSSSSTDLKSSSSSSNTPSSLSSVSLEEETFVYKAEITFDASVQGTHTDFPVLIDQNLLPDELLDADGGQAAQTDGGDIRFSADEAGETRLPVDFVSITLDNAPANAKAEIWVKVPTLTSGTSIWVWWRPRSGTYVQPPADATYGSRAVWSDYELVYHGGSDLTNEVDGTTGTQDSGSFAEQLIGDALDATDTSVGGEIIFPVNYGGVANFTYQAFVRPNSTSAGFKPYLLVGEPGTVRGEIRKRDINSNMEAYLTIAGGIRNIFTSSAFSTGTDYHIAGTHDGSTFRAYKSGAFAGSTNVSGNVNAGTQVVVGNSTTPSQAWLDEARIAHVTRSADWLLTESRFFEDTSQMGTVSATEETQVSSSSSDTSESSVSSSTSDSTPTSESSVSTESSSESSVSASFSSSTSSTSQTSESSTSSTSISSTSPTSESSASSASSPSDSSASSLSTETSSSPTSDTSSSSESSTSSTSTSSTATSSSTSSDSDSSNLSSSSSTDSSSSVTSQSQSTDSTSSQSDLSESSDSTSSQTSQSDSTDSTSSPSTVSSSTSSVSATSDTSTSSTSSQSTGSTSSSSSSDSPLRVYPVFNRADCRGRYFQPDQINHDNIFTQELDVIDNAWRSQDVASSMGLVRSKWASVTVPSIYYDFLPKTAPRHQPRVLIRHEDYEFVGPGVGGGGEGSIVLSNWSFELSIPADAQCGNNGAFAIQKALRGVYLVFFTQLRSSGDIFVRLGSDRISGPVEPSEDGMLTLSGQVSFEHTYSRDNYTVNSIGTNLETGTGVPLSQRSLKLINFSLNGSGTDISVGTSRQIQVFFNGTIKYWALTADQTGSLKIDVQKTDDETTPDVTDSIAGGDEPELVANSFDESSALSSWSLAVSAGDIIRFEVLSGSGIETAVLTLAVQAF